MRERSEPVRCPSFVPTAIRIVLAAFSVGLILFSVRVPAPLYVKLPLLLGIGLVIRWLFGFPRTMEGEFYFKQGLSLERNGAYAKAVHCYELAAARVPRHPRLSLRLLAAYDADHRINTAKDFIRSMDGMVFSKEDIEELEFLMAQYRPVTFERKGGGYILRFR